MNILVGYTGFVGSNLAQFGEFDEFYHSKNIKDAYGKNPDLLVYAGVPAQKFLANKFPQQDLDTINQAIENIKGINPKKIVLISTIDVYSQPFNVDENSDNKWSEEPYGKNRRILECWVKDNFKDYHIVRLPGLFGLNLKKNFIYDYIQIIPSMLNDEKFNELVKKRSEIQNYYTKEDNGFYKLIPLSYDERTFLKKVFKDVGFTALNFTDSRGVFQFYNLEYIWKHIQIAIDNNIKILNVATEPVNISEVFTFLENCEYKNELQKQPPMYNFKTQYANIFGGENGYIFNKKEVLEQIKDFVGRTNKKHLLSISNIAWGPEFDNEMFKILKDNQFDGLEIAPTRVIPENPYENIDTIKNFKQNIKKMYGLNIASLQSIWYGKTGNIFNSEIERLDLIDYTKKAIDFASAVNCNNLVFGCPKNRNIPNGVNKTESEKIAVEFFKQIGQYAKIKNVVVSIEPNPPIYNTNFINTTKQAIELAKKVDCENIKVNLDLGTMIHNNEKIDILINEMKYINHIHISEPHLEAIKEREIHKELIKFLKDENYSKYVSIEMKKTEDISIVKQSIEYIRRLFNEN